MLRGSGITGCSGIYNEWNTLYMEVVLDQLQREGFPVSPAAVSRLSPLIFGYSNMLGRDAVLVPDAMRRGELWLLQTPSDALDDVA
jgi:hypothetical protein